MRIPTIERFVLLAIICSPLTLASCDEDATPVENDPPPKIEERVIRDVDFVKNKFFFLDYPSSGTFTPPRPGKVELYRSVPGPVPSLPPGTWARAYVDSLGDGTAIGRGSDFELGFFEYLELGTDFYYVLDPRDFETIVGIELVRPLFLGEALAAAYINEDGDTIGDFDPLVFSPDKDNPLYFELIWPSFPVPHGPYGYTWSFTMRHIYDLGLTNIDGNRLEIEILEQCVRPDCTVPANSEIPWIRIFGLDRTDGRGTGPPDAKVDLLSGVVDLVEGRLTFPVLTPFDPPADSVAEWTDGEFSFTGEYADLLNPGLYTRGYTDPGFLSKFEIRVRAVMETE